MCIQSYVIHLYYDYFHDYLNLANAVKLWGASLCPGGLHPASTGALSATDPPGGRGDGAARAPRQRDAPLPPSPRASPSPMIRAAQVRA